MAMVSRKEPPRWAVTTIIPALGGASRISFHSSDVKSDFDVIRGLRSLQWPALLAVRTVAPGLAPRAVGRGACRVPSPTIRQRAGGAQAASLLGVGWIR